MAPVIVWRPSLYGARHCMAPWVIVVASLYGAVGDCRGVIAWVVASLYGAVASFYEHPVYISMSSACPVRDK